MFAFDILIQSLSVFSLLVAIAIPILVIYIVIRLVAFFTAKEVVKQSKTHKK